MSTAPAQQSQTTTKGALQVPLLEAYRAVVATVGWS